MPKRPRAAGAMAQCAPSSRRDTALKGDMQVGKSAVFLLLIGVLFGAIPANANLLTNGNLDRSYAQEIVPGFFLPKPANWVNEGSRAITGPYEDEMSSEPWAGPAPTPVTNDGLLDPPHPAGVGGPDGAVFFKAFSGSAANGAATGHLYQDVAGTAGLTFRLTGWAGAEANYLAERSVFAIDFLDSLSNIISSSELDLVAAGLFVPNGEPFNYKQYSLTGVAPVGTVFVRSRVSMIGGMPNPAGGGQAFVVDDFELTAASPVPEPSTMLLVGAGLAAVRRLRRAR